jgi:SPW repeat-containing protein
MTGWKRWQDYATMAIGILLFVTPFVFGDTGQTVAATSAYVLGALLFLGGLLAALARSVGSLEIIPVVLGVVTFVAPWVLGFTAVTAVAWAAWVLGVLAVLSAGGTFLAAGRRTTTA